MPVAQFVGIMDLVGEEVEGRKVGGEGVTMYLCKG